MQFMPLSIVTIARPTVTNFSLLQMMSFALAADLKKYAFTYVLNDLTSSQKDQKKLQNTQTCISTLSLEEIIQGKSEAKPLQVDQKNRKSQDSLKTQQDKQEKIEFSHSIKRKCYQRGRCQINQGFELYRQSNHRQEGDSNKKEEEQITCNNKIQSKIEQGKQSIIRKYKQIRKGKKVQKHVQKVEPEHKIWISTSVSLIETIDHPRISICRYEIQQKKYNLLSRAIVYDEFEQRKSNYQIRQRREFKRLN